MKRIATAAVACAATLGAVLTSAPAASAESNTPTYASCRGTVERSVPIKNASGTTLSRVQVYFYGRERGSEVCVRNVHVGGTVGRSMWTMVSLGSKYDRGHYTHYAGAIREPAWIDSSYSVKVGVANPSNPDRDYGCKRIDGRIGDHYAPRIWLCYSTAVSRG